MTFQFQLHFKFLKFPTENTQYNKIFYKIKHLVSINFNNKPTLSAKLSIHTCQKIRQDSYNYQNFKAY